MINYFKHLIYSQKCSFIKLFYLSIIIYNKIKHNLLMLRKNLNNQSSITKIIYNIKDIFIAKKFIIF